MADSDELSHRTHFPHFGQGTPLQVVRWTGQRVGGVFTGTSTRFTIPSGAAIVEISATENCYIAFGGDSVEATSAIANDASRLFVAGAQVAPVPLTGGVPYTHVAVIQQSASGVFQVEEVE